MPTMPRKRAPSKTAKPIDDRPQPNGNQPGPLSSIEKWKAAGRPMGKNKQRAIDQAVHNSGPDMPPGKLLAWLPKPEEVPPKPTEEPEMEFPGPGHMRFGHPEWQLHSVIAENPKDLAAAGEPWVLSRTWKVRWAPPDDARCIARSIGKFSEWMGNRCTMKAIRGARVCHAHGGKLTTVKKAAQTKLGLAALPAAEKLIHIALTKKGVADSDRIRALLAILDRAGVEGRATIEMEVKPWQSVLQNVYSAATGQTVENEEIEGIDFELGTIEGDFWGDQGDDEAEDEGDE